MKTLRKRCIKTLIRCFPRCILNILPDKAYISLFYFYSYGKLPNLAEPKTFDEKLQWYKLYYRKDEMAILADKFAVRQYVSDKGLGHILNELYFAKEKISKDDLAQLPEKFVIKATHGSGMNIIQNGQNYLEAKTIVKRVNKWLNTNYYYHGREWAYKNIRPSVIAEKFLSNDGFNELIDYKFYCYNGKPTVVFACSGRFTKRGVGYNAYDMNWNQIHIYKGKPGVDIVFKVPVNFDEMKECARILSGSYPFIRVDLYSIEGKTIFGELTFYPDSGIIPFHPDEYNYYFGDLFELPT